MKSVPIIVVVTKFDLFLAGLAKRGKVKGLQLAEQTFKHMFGHKFDKFEASLDRRIPYALVSSKFVAGITSPALTSSSRIAA